MNDVLTPCGGYLPVFIDMSGYILIPELPNRKVIHRETRDLHEHTLTHRCLSVAKEDSAITGNAEMLPAVLQLTSDGGGEAVWVFSDRKDEAKNRLQRFKGCYGTWPVYSF